MRTLSGPCSRSPRWLLFVGLAASAACGGGGGSSADAGPPRPDAAPPTAATAVYAPPTPGQAADWGVVPFPSDLYLDASGHLALARLPDGTGANPDDEAKMREALATLDGAGVWSNVYFPVDGDLDPSTLAAHVKLVDLDGALAEIPIDVIWRPDLHTIVAAPRWGTMLLQDHRYAAFVLAGVKATDGSALARAPAFTAATTANGMASDPAILAAAASLKPLLDAYPTPADLVDATVFRTEHVTRGMQAMRAVVAASPPPVKSVDRLASSADELNAVFGVSPDGPPGLDEVMLRPLPHTHVGLVLHGTMEFDNFLAATPGVAGFVELDGQGVAQVKGKETLKFTLILPAAASWASTPVVIYVHGLNRTRQEMIPVAETLNKAGMAVLSIDLPYHGDRAKSPRDVRNDITAVPGADGFGDVTGLTPAIDFFHLSGDSGPVPALHPRGTRDTLRQAASEICALAAFVEGGDLTTIRAAIGAVGGLPDDLSFRPGSAIVTESFGSMISSLALAVEPRIHSAVLGVAATGFPYPAVLHSASFSGTFSGVVLTPFAIAERIVLGDPVRGARFDPMVNLYNQTIEPGDSAPFGPYLRTGELRGGTPVNLLLSMNWNDEVVNNESTEALIGAIGAPLVPLALPQAPPGELVRWATLATAQAPLSGNVGGDHTIGFVVYYPGIHGFLRYMRGKVDFSSPNPPFVKQTPSQPVFTHIAEYHSQIVRFLGDAFAGQVPMIIDPFTP